MTHLRNGFLEKIGGHIGYGVIPGCRKQGFATEMLKEALPICSSLGIKKTLARNIRQVYAMKRRNVVVNDLMQKNYIYNLIAPVGKGFHAEFSPELTPKQMLEMGVFGGKYMTDCGDEYPTDWYAHAKLCHERMHFVKYSG